MFISGTTNFLIIDVNFYVLYPFQYNQSASYMVSEMTSQVFSVPPPPHKLLNYY